MGDILPVILGSDFNAYNVARTFHEAYGVSSITIGKGVLIHVKASSFISSLVCEQFDDNEKFIAFMIDFANQHQDKQLILMAASEHYVYKIFQTYEALRPYFVIPYADGKLGRQLSDKAYVYHLFEKMEIDYPKYMLASPSVHCYDTIPYDFPVVLKPTNSTTFFDLAIDNKEKAYIVSNLESLNNILNHIYQAGYQDDMFIQQYVHGTHRDEYVMNVYMDAKERLTLQSIGRIVLDDPNPLLRGNYLAIENVEWDENIKQLFKKIEHFLKNIGFRGIANFDFKKDAKSGKFMCFEMNLRQGRSSFFSTLSGANFAKAIVNDYLLEREEYQKGELPFLWYVTDFELIKTLLRDEPELLDTLMQKENKNGTLEYFEHESEERALMIRRYFEQYHQNVAAFL